MALNRGQAGVAQRQGGRGVRACGGCGRARRSGEGWGRGGGGAVWGIEFERSLYKFGIHIFKKLKFSKHV